MVAFVPIRAEKPCYPAVARVSRLL